MPQEEIKPIYDSLLESGDLKTMYSDMTGDWEKDKDKFTRLYSQNEDILSGDLDFDLEY